MLLWAYNTFLFSGAALGAPFILPLLMLSQKRRKTFWKRLGFTTVPALPDQTPKPIWVHALSVGEIQAAIPLVRALREFFSDRMILFSVSTLSGFEFAIKKIEGIQPPVFFFPYDWRPSVKAIVKRVDPAVVMILETDLWPNFIFYLDQKKIPLILVNARISSRSYIRYKRFQPVIRKLFSRLSGVCAPSDEDARHFMMLGVPRDRIRITGNLKFEHAGFQNKTPATQALNKKLGFDSDQKLIAAGSTHKGEEEKIFRAFSKIKKRFPQTGLLLAPRDPSRAAALCRLSASLGIKTALMSERERGVSHDAACLAVDRLGVMEQIYGAADIVFIGGSMVPEGGHNPLEAAAWAKPILFGPDMSDFASISESLLSAGGARRVDDGPSLAEQAIRLLEDPAAAAEMGLRALHVAEEGRGALKKILDMVSQHLPDPANAKPAVSQGWASKCQTEGKI